METSLKTGFAQIFSCCPKKLSCPKFGGAAAPLAPPARTPMTLSIERRLKTRDTHISGLQITISVLLDELALLECYILNP